MKAALSLALVFCAACRSTVPGAVPPVDPAAALTPAPGWTAPTAVEGPDLHEAFWEQLGSPRLNALVEEGLERSPNLALAAQRVLSAAAALESAAAADLPSIQASLSSSRSRVNFIGLPVPGTSGVLTSESSSHALGVSIAWEVDLWGRLATAQRGAAANLEAESFDFVAARQSLAAQIVKAALSLVEAHEAASYAREARRIAEAELRDASRRVASGQGGVEDEWAARAALAEADATLAGAQRRVQLLGPPLALLLGRASGRDNLLGEVELEQLASELRTADLPPPPPAGLPAELLARRPDLAALEARLRAAQAGAEVAHAALLPQLSLTGNAGTSGSELRNLLDGDFQVWSLGANLLAPLWNGGGLRAAEEQAVADRDAALLAYVQGALVAFSEADAALSAEQLLRSEHERRREAVELRAEAEALLLRKNKRGSAPAAVALAARAAAVAARQAELSTWRERLTQRVDLCLALGGGFELGTTP